MEDVLPFMIPLMALAIPIIVVLTKHQQRMAELIHGGAGNQQQIEALKREVGELRSLVHQQAIQIDNMSNRLGTGSDVRQNLNLGG